MENNPTSSPSADQNDYNKSGMIAFMFSMATSLLVLVYVSFFSGGIDLKEVAPPSDEAAPTQQLAAAGPIDVSDVQEPWISSDQLVAAGNQIYQINCAMCHGAEGRGDGVAGASLNPKPRNLVQGGWKLGGGRLGLMRVLNEGISGTSMQAYTHLPVNERWAMVHYIMSITQDKGGDNDAEVAARAPAIK
jgi:mono/diheme cytochrome c family protein